MVEKNKVVVAMSGGVDSSVAAALLKQQGYDVVGIFLKFWSPQENICRENACCNYESLQSARKVCEILDMPLHIFDVKDIFKKEIVDYFIDEYERGRTPNPCVICNKKIKFGWLLEKAHKLGCEYLATGHYARLEQKNNQIEIFKAKDKRKDQTYFLWQLTNEQLKHIIFPLANYTKIEVRQLAQKFHLPTYNKTESQDICFIHHGVKDFLEKYAHKMSNSGNVVDKNGAVIGKHEGLMYYTVGQRENLPKIDYGKISFDVDRHRIPALYVIKLDADKNQLVIGIKNDLFGRKLVAGQVNWLSAQGETICEAIIRYNQRPIKCHIKRVYDKVEVNFTEPVQSITPGQSIVFYIKDQLIGGGIIQ